MKKYFKNLGLKILADPLKYSTGLTVFILFSRVYYNWWKAELGTDIQAKIYHGLIVVINLAIICAVTSFTNRKLLLDIQEKLNNNGKEN
jgi:tetrahydromethanopterin S-methyltransferase subunit E